MRIAEQLAQSLTEASLTEMDDSALLVVDRILSDIDRYIAAHLEHELGMLKDGLKSAEKQIAGLKNAGAGKTEHDSILLKVVMPAWHRFESQVTDMGTRFKKLEAAAKAGGREWDAP